MEMHEAMGGGHLSVKDFSVDQLHYLPTHSKLTEVLQERSTEIKSTADPREEELAILEAERAAIEAEELARLEAEQAAIEAEEARLAEQQALEEVEEDKSWWSKTVSAVSDTVEKAVDTVGNAASSAYNYVTENPAASLSAVVDFVPVVGNLKAGIEAATGYDPLTGRRLEPWERAVSGGAILGGAAVKGASKVAKFAKNADNVGDVARVSTGNAPVPIKQGGGSNPKDFVNPHSEKHMYDPSRPSTPNRSQYGENVDVSKLRKETVANPDKAYSNWPNPNNPNPNKITKYYKEFEGNISTPNTPTGSHRVFDNIGNPTRSSHFPYVPRK
ncbi:pre-toxin TG domain-containing protein [Bacillus sp. A116_S68]|nr:pre-toxin TG domain-containing protein [Bacillus sp. A116_S68]